MRKITRQIIEAFIECRSFIISNSRTDETSLYLHGNRIAWHDGNNIIITNAGWFSNTTKERLNALPGVHISQKKGEWYLNGALWDGKPTVILTTIHYIQ